MLICIHNNGIGGLVSRKSCIRFVWLARNRGLRCASSYLVGSVASYIPTDQMLHVWTTRGPSLRSHSPQLPGFIALCLLAQVSQWAESTKAHSDVLLSLVAKLSRRIYVHGLDSLQPTYSCTLRSLLYERDVPAHPQQHRSLGVQHRIRRIITTTEEQVRGYND